MTAAIRRKVAAECRLSIPLMTSGVARRRSFSSLVPIKKGKKGKTVADCPSCDRRVTTDTSETFFVFTIRRWLVAIERAVKNTDGIIFVDRDAKNRFSR